MQLIFGACLSQVSFGILNVFKCALCLSIMQLQRVDVQCMQVYNSIYC